MKKLLLTGGGTAGHVTPHLALLPLLENHFEIHYIGSHKGIERSIMQPKVASYKGISVGKLRRYFSWENFKDLFRVLCGTVQAYFYIRKLKPDLVFSKGGFVAVPVVIGAKLNHVPIVCHESDYTPGIATKISAKFAKTVCTTFEDCAKFFGARGIYTGTPLRDSLFTGNAEKARLDYGFDQKPVLLIMGGSQGALAVNNAVQAILDELLPQFNILHLCGEGKKVESLSGKAGYVQVEYLNETLADALALADIVISRSGSNSICELRALHKPMLLIPLPSSGVSRGDQVLNANYYTKKGFAHTLLQEDITEDSLLAAIQNLYAHKDELIANLQNAESANGAEKVSRILLNCVK
ncbi:MAG: undecaprenyldiphospho-muramoylpentapeptide beta-N-acetylglucosaminyltransferase [Eubacteriales bacterium]|nr:undecaprenyldiphospho-muramoylpentapeptide beta-N-acetylglucosaminyltransferase [Eubacteriales bacterium]